MGHVIVGSFAGMLAGATGALAGVGIGLVLLLWMVVGTSATLLLVLIAILRDHAAEQRASATVIPAE